MEHQQAQVTLKVSEISSVGKKSTEIPAWAKVLWMERAELNYFVNTEREEASSGQMVNWCCAKGSGRSCNLRRNATLSRRHMRTSEGSCGLSSDSQVD